MARRAPSTEVGTSTQPDGKLLAAMARRIRDLRQVRGLTQEQFAQRAGISVSFVSMIERGERSPSYETLHQLAQGLDLHVAELLRDEPDDTRGRHLEPLLDFLRRARLTRPQVERLVQVARALFGVDGHASRIRPALRGKVCSMEGCGRPLLARALCASHYHAERRRRRTERR